MGAERANSSEQINSILFEYIFGGSDIAQRPFLYRPLNELSAVMQSRAQPLERLVDTRERALARHVLAG